MDVACDVNGSKWACRRRLTPSLTLDIFLRRSLTIISAAMFISSPHHSYARAVESQAHGHKIKALPEQRNEGGGEGNVWGWEVRVVELLVEVVEVPAWEISASK